MVYKGNCEYATVGSKCLSASGLLVLEPWVSKGKEGDPGRTEISIVHAFKVFLKYTSISFAYIAQRTCIL